jgi:hypothetical protein
MVFGESWDYVRKGVTQTRERERKGRGTPGRMPKYGAIRIWLSRKLEVTKLGWLPVT